MRNVIEIYKKALDRLSNKYILELGPAHIVWGDLNLEDDHIKWCIENFEDYDETLSPNEKAVILWSLIELLEIPEAERLEMETPF